MAPAPVRRRGLSAGAAAGSGPWVDLVVVSGTEVAAALSGLGRLPGGGKDPVPIQDGSPGKGRGGQPPLHLHLRTGSAELTPARSEPSLL